MVEVLIAGEATSARWIAPRNFAPHPADVRAYLNILALLGLLVACGSPSDSAPDQSGTPAFEDDLGRIVRPPQVIRRVIPLAPNLTEIIVAAGGESFVAAISASDDYPGFVLDRPIISTYPLGIERVVELGPDLLLANAEVNRVSDADRLSRLGIETYFFTFDSIESVPRAMRAVGDLLGTRERAEAAAAEFEREMGTLRGRSARLGTRPKVLLLIGSETLYAFGGDSFTTELIEIAGGESTTKDFRGEGVTLSAEYVLSTAPDVIVGAWTDDSEIERFLAQHPALRSLDAVREGRIHAIDPDIVVRAGPRLVEAARTLADLILAPDP